MIGGTPGLIASLLTLLALTIILVALAVGILQPIILRHLTLYSVSVRSGLLWCCALAPYLIGLFMVFLSQLPFVLYRLGLMADHCEAHFNDHGHLCWAHPFVFMLLSWQGALALALAALVTWTCCAALIFGWRQYRLVRLLKSLSRLENNIYRLESDMPCAFTLGWFKPTVMVSNALFEHLSAAEVAVIVVHEKAHQRARDPLQLWLFKTLMSIYPPGIGRTFYNALHLTREQLADAVAVRAGKAPTFVAHTLVKVQALVSRYQANMPTPHLWPSVSRCNYMGADVESRVLGLLLSPTTIEFPFVRALALLTAVVLAGLCSAHGVHHFWEALLHVAPPLTSS